LKRGHLRPVENFELADGDFDVAGRQARILGTRGAPPDDAAHAQYVLVAEMFGLRETRVLRIEDDLSDPRVVAKIDENQAAVIAAAIDPTVERDRRAFVAGPQRTASNPLRHPYPSFMPET
jgi:hypothetical protein